MRWLQGAVVSVLLGGVAFAGPEQLWGQPGEAPIFAYLQTCTKARHVLNDSRQMTPEALRGVVTLLRDATRLYADGAEGWGLLGRALLELGDVEGARPALLAALRRGAADSRFLMSLALLSAKEGDLSGALELYLRLQRRGMTTPLLLRRSADVLMALGRLGEAMENYRRACPLGGAGFPEQARACLGLAVAYDRDGRLQASAAALKRARPSQVGPRALDGADFIPPADRAYYEALAAEARQAPPCEQAQPLKTYLAELGSSALSPRSYGARAEARLDRLAGSCKAAYSPIPGTINEPLGSQKDRDGGVPWQPRAEEGPK